MSLNSRGRVGSEGKSLPVLAGVCFREVAAPVSVESVNAFLALPLFFCPGLRPRFLGSVCSAATESPPTPPSAVDEAEDWVSGSLADASGRESLGVVRFWRGLRSFLPLNAEASALAVWIAWLSRI